MAELKRIKAAGVTMIWIEHVVHALLAIADRLFVLNFGQKLAEGLAARRDGRRRGAPRLHGHGSVSAMLSTAGLTAFYGDAQALFGIDFELAAGEVVAIIGANGAGKSTFMKAVTGLVKAAPEQIRFDGEAIGGLPPAQIVRRGIALVPEGRRLFPSLSVEENLKMGGVAGRPGPWNLGRLYRLFPVLDAKRRRSRARRSPAASSRWWRSAAP